MEPPSRGQSLRTALGLSKGGSAALLEKTLPFAELDVFFVTNAPSLAGSCTVGLGFLLLLGTSTAFAQADAARAKQIAGGACFLCHGERGESTSELFPRLAGQHAECVAKQRTTFQSEQHESSTMSSMVTKLTADDMLALGSDYAQMSLPREAAKDPQRAELGRHLYHNGNKFSGVPACSSCQGAALATQFSGYIQTQLKSFGRRARTNDNAVMHSMMEKRTGLEMAAVAAYVSSK